MLASFWSEHDHLLTAIASVVIALGLAGLVNRAVTRRGRALTAGARRLPGGGALTPQFDTRLRFMRNVATATIILVGVMVALSQFDALDRIATTVLASSAITVAVIGFAARQTLANGVAGLQLAVTQPLRVGDSVSFDGHDGVVDDVRLTYTYLHTAGGARIAIPNERLAAGVLRNDTILGQDVAAEISLWLASQVDATRALLAVTEGLDDTAATIAEVLPWGTRLAVTGPPGTPMSRLAREATLRADAYTALRAAGLA